ncbi:MAG: ATP-binding cassette domain-containing protein [Lachnospiraceae bacterium]|nr:ATP-binding cassette domain-containing protein [Lachnospiraceae bacterium]MDU3181602.1 ATP-binding cassette domain-containing protein [Lachnospiraceae bacterium]
MQLSAENISFRYTEKSPWILKDINLQIETGERVGIVGPSGYGKSTLAKILAGYNRANSGQVLLDGKPLQTKGFCPVQMIYQHPELAVNPRWKMEKILKECWNPDEKILERFGIEKDWLTRWPRELSGGELQRFCIVRLLSPETKFLICDEITTMLDVISQAQIWNVLLEMAEERNYGMLIVTHNMDLAKRVCTRIVDLSEINRR